MKGTMKKRWLSALFLLVVFLVHTAGKPVTRGDVILAVHALLSRWDRVEPVEIQSIEPGYLSNGELGYYLADLGRSGWVLVSADDVIRPVIAFSFENSYTPESEWNGTARYLLDHYRSQIDAALKEPQRKRDTGWDRLELPSGKKSATGVYVDPFIEVKWNQGSGWNRFCPYDEDGPGNHAYVGCVGVAMAQAMTVFNFPSKPRGMKSYINDTYGYISVNYDLAPLYSWEEMSSSSPDSFNAALLYHCAVSVNMDFGPDGSGAYARNTPGSLVQYFGYSKNVRFKEQLQDPQEWEDLLVSELQEGRPIIYRGGPDNGGDGHAWNIDGYGDGYFHMNFGWSGSQNGYYSLNLIDPGSYDFTSNQGAVTGIAPPVSSPYDIILSELAVDEGLPVGSHVADVTVEDEDPMNVYTFTCKGKYNFLLRDYGPASFYVEDDQLLTDKVFEFNEEDPGSNSEFLLIIVEDQYGHKYQEEFNIEITEQINNSTGMQPFDNDWLYIYPNPADDYFVIPEMPGQGLSFSVIDITGKEVMIHQGPVFPGSHHEIANLEPGIYFIFITGKDTTFTGKLVVHR
jgi:hypothetical protein